MSLVITMRNISNLAEVSDYEVKVFINYTQIDGPFIIKGHKRSDGYKPMVKLLSDHFFPKKKAPKRKKRSNASWRGPND